MIEPTVYEVDWSAMPPAVAALLARQGNRVERGFPTRIHQIAIDSNATISVYGTVQSIDGTRTWSAAPRRLLAIGP